MQREGSRRYLSSALIALLMFSLIGLAFVPPVRAFTNNRDGTGQGIGTSASTYTISSVSGLTVGDLFVFGGYCQGTSVAISTITDGSGDTFIPISTVFNDLDGWSFQGAWAIGTATSTGTITITMNTSSAKCLGLFQSYNTDALNLAPLPLQTAGFINSCTYSSGYCVQATAINYQAGVTTTSADNLVVAFLSQNRTEGASCSGGGCPGGAVYNAALSPSSPLGTITQVTTGSSCTVAPLCRLNSAWVYQTSANSNQHLGFSYLANNACLTASCGVFSGTVRTAITVYALVFQSNGSPVPTCSGGSFSSQIGGTVQSASSYPMTSNTTYLYTGSTGALPVNLVSMAATLGTSLTLTNGQTQAFFTSALYVATNLNTITAANPMTRVASGSVTLVNTASPIGTINTNLNYAVPANSQYAIAVGVSHEGLNIYQTTSSVTMSHDTSDSFVGGKLPVSITTSVNVSPPFLFNANLVTPCVVTSITTTSISASQSTQIINAPPPNSAQFWFIPLFFLLAPVALLIGGYGLYRGTRK